MNSQPSLLMMFKLTASLILLYISRSLHAATVDLTAANRRPAVVGLPDWSKVGFMQGRAALPTDASVTRTITADMLRNQYGVIPDDGVDDTDALQQVIQDCRSQSQAPNYTLIQLPAGVINLSYTIYIDSNYLIIRGAGNDPAAGGTQLVFKPNSNTVYDSITANGDRWDLDGMSYAWDIQNQSGKQSGSATSGWLWPGRSIFRIGSKDIAPKYTAAAAIAPANRVDFFWGSVNYHWRIDGKTKGFLASQKSDIAGSKGSNRVFINNASDYAWAPGVEVWISSPVRSNDYVDWGVTDESYFANSYLFQDWFTVTGTGTDSERGPYLDLDHSLRFDVYANSTSAGSPIMEDSVSFAKVMAIEDPIIHVGIEDLYMTQLIDGFQPSDAQSNYGNLKPAEAMHGIVLRFAKDCWIRNIKTFMTGSHPVATEAARNIQVQDSYFDGAWNKGSGGNGYLRGSRVWDSLFFNITQRNLRHFTFQWSAMGNVASFFNTTNDMNLHGGFEGYNLLELNYVAPPYSHRPRSCSGHCGGEGGASESGTWWPIYWSTGAKASKWSGATGPQNVFYRNYMIKQPSPNVDFVDYTPYFARDGSLSGNIWQFGQDRQSISGDHYQHLSLDSCTTGTCLLQDWEDYQQHAFSVNPSLGVNGQLRDLHTSLFLRDVSAVSTGITTFSSISGYTFCRGNYEPKVVGYYLASSAANSCAGFTPNLINTTPFTHIIFSYAQLATNGAVTVPSSYTSLLQSVTALKASKPGLKVYLAIGGYGLGADSSALVAVANSASARTRLGASALTLLNGYNLDGVDIEWVSGITANQFNNVVAAVKTAFGNSAAVSISTPSDFWDLSGVNKVTSQLGSAVDFLTLITHSFDATTGNPNAADKVEATVSKARNAGFASTQMLLGIPFYARSPSNSKTSQCIGSSDLGQGTYPYYALDSILNHGQFDNNAYTSYTLDPVTSAATIVLQDNTALSFDGPESVTYKTGLAADLCMGGVSVYSIDQDTKSYNLVHAIRDPGNA